MRSACDSPVLSLIGLDALTLKHRAVCKPEQALKDTPLKAEAMMTIRIETNAFPFCLLLDLNNLDLVASFKENKKQIVLHTPAKAPKPNPQEQFGKALEDLVRQT